MMSKDIDGIATEILEERAMEVLEEMQSIKTQLGHAKAEAHETGCFSDRRWFQGAQHALRMKGVEHQKLEREIGKRKKAERVAKNQEFNQAIVTVAKKKKDWRQICLNQ